MTDDAPGPNQQTLVGVSFPDHFRAQEFLTAASRLAANGRLRLIDAVFVTKDEAGHTVVKETIDPAPLPSAMSGALWAGLFGLLLGGPVGWIAGLGVGATTGAVAAKVIDHGVSDEWVDWFRQSVANDTTTLALLLEDLDRGALVGELERFAGATLVYANVDPYWTDRMRTALTEAPGEAGEHGDPAEHGDPGAPTPEEQRSGEG